MFFRRPMIGKKRNIHRKDFLIYADACGIGQVPATKMIRRLISLKPRFVAMCEESLLTEGMKEGLIRQIEERCGIFEG